MTEILFVDEDPRTLTTLVESLQSDARDDAVGRPATVDVAIVDLRRLDASGLSALLALNNRELQSPVILARGFKSVQDALGAVQRAASDLRDNPPVPGELSPVRETHAAARWARAVVPIVDSPGDIPNMAAWSRCVAVSVGALRNWCRTAGIGARRSLVFGRMLRVAVIGEEQGERAIGNLLDVVDLRTISGLVKLAGLTREVPTTVAGFLDQQILVRNEDALNEIRRAFERRAEYLSGPGRLRTDRIAS